MRKPFIFILLILSFWIWSLDLVDIIFYYLKQPYSKATGYGLALIPFCILSLLFTRLFLKFYGLTKSTLRISKKQLQELGWLLLFFTPILYLNFTRIMFPDATYDVGAYHLYLQQLNRYENLQHFNMVGGGGGGTYFFTLSYKIFGFFRILLGFRMGTLFNSFLLFVCFVCIYDFLKRICQSYLEKIKVPALLLYLSALFAIFSTNTLFIVNSYVVDVLGIPLLFELLFIVLFKKLTDQNRLTVTLFFFLLTSVLIAYKLTSLPYILILGLCFIIRNYTYLLKEKQLILFAFLSLLFPSIYLIYNYTETLNPIFPFYNKLFKSDLYPIENFRDRRWGPANILEVFYYNIICATNPVRNNEWGLFSGRLLAEYLLILFSLVTLVYNKFKIKDSFTRIVIATSVIALLLNYMLLFTTGYYRYGIIIEMLFGINLVLWSLYFFQHKKYILFSLVIVLSLVQCVNSFNVIYKHQVNVSWYQYKSLRNGNHGTELKNQLKLLFRDRQTKVEQQIASLKIDAFLSSDCDGYSRSFSPGTPIYNVTSYGNRKETIIHFEKNVIDTLTQRHNVYSLARLESLTEKIRNLNARNYFVDSIVDVYSTFTTNDVPLYLLKLKHYNPDSFKIVTIDSFIRNKPGTKNDIANDSIGSFKLFTIIDPYTYNWEFQEKQAKFEVNGESYTLNFPDNHNRILILPGNKRLEFRKQNEFNYLVIIQELKQTGLSKDE